MLVYQKKYTCNILPWVVPLISIFKEMQLLIFCDFCGWRSLQLVMDGLKSILTIHAVGLQQNDANNVILIAQQKPQHVLYVLVCRKWIFTFVIMEKKWLKKLGTMNFVSSGVKSILKSNIIGLHQAYPSYVIVAHTRIHQVYSTLSFALDHITPYEAVGKPCLYFLQSNKILIWLTRFICCRI